MLITRRDIKDKSRYEVLVDVKLNEMGVAEMEDGVRIGLAAKEYYMGLLQEHVNLSDNVVFNDYSDDSEAFVLSFVAGYAACLKNN